jgi:predicted AAA+ superfamily ATPase
MQTYIKRSLTNSILARLQQMPAVALLGPRQCGKSTLAKHLISPMANGLYLDLEKSSDLNKLRDPETFFSHNRDKLICLDEIQRVPELFSFLRSTIDEENRHGRFLMLGSASRDLIQQSSESLAGRIAYLEMTPFQLGEVGDPTLRTLWLQGGFPRSFLTDLEASHAWRIDFIRTFLERDIPQLGFAIPAQSMERLWRMCAHSHGQTLNASKIGGSLGTSHHTVHRYIDILAATFLLRILPPYEANIKKRLIKSPKIYLRDSGLLHALLDIETQNDLLGHPILGASWEGFVLENIITATPDWRHFFYRTATGVELDLIMEKGLRRIALECKASIAPKPSKGFWQALDDLAITEAWIIAPINGTYPIEKNVNVGAIANFLRDIKN